MNSKQTLNWWQFLHLHADLESQNDSKFHGAAMPQIYLFKYLNFFFGVPLLILDISIEEYSIHPRSCGVQQAQTSQ